uniref:Cytochrome P450 n=1 Tax=Globodera pallida TaxID=36090 RepID=A0A183CFG0_GLOPA
MAILVAMFGALSSANSFGLLPISLLLLSVLVWLLGKRRAVQRHQTFPPGPSPLPLIGNLAQIDLVNPHRTFVAWKRRYGPIYTVWLPKPHVVIAGEKELDEYFLSPAYADKFADRPTHSFLYGIFNKHQPDGDGIILARREVAQKNRRFALGAFRQLGISGTRGEALIRLQVDSLVRRLAEKALHEPLLDDLHSQFAFCIGNIIHHLVTGRHYGYNDSEFLQSKKLIDCVVEERLFLREIDAHVERLQLQLQLHQRQCQDGTERRHQQTADGEHVDQGDGLTTAMSEEITTATTSRRTEEEMKLLEPSLIPDNFIDAFLLASSAEEEGHVQQQQQNWHQPALCVFK